MDRGRPVLRHGLDRGASSVSFSLTNTGEATVTSLTSSLNPSTYGQSVKFTAIVGNAIGGGGPHRHRHVHGWFDGSEYRPARSREGDVRDRRASRGPELNHGGLQRRLHARAEHLGGVDADRQPRRNRHDGHVVP